MSGAAAWQMEQEPSTIKYPVEIIKMADNMAYEKGNDGKSGRADPETLQEQVRPIRETGLSC